jgi:hypothetical protein
MTRKARLAIVIGALAASIIAGDVLGDALRPAGSGDLRGGALLVCASAILGAAYAAARLRTTSLAPGRAAGAGAIVASVVAFLLLRFPSPWVDLGPFGAGPLTAVTVVVLPLAVLATVLATTAWVEP